MVLAFLRLCQGLPGTGRESQVNSASERATEKNIFMKKSLEFNFQEDRHLQSQQALLKLAAAGNIILVLLVSNPKMK